MTRRKDRRPIPMIETFHPTFDPALFPTPRHQARHRHSAYYWAAWTLILWTLGAIAAMLSPAVSGFTFGPLMIAGLVLFLAGIATFLIGWRRLP